MSYRIMTWAAVAWIAVWLTPYLYAVNDLITCQRRLRLHGYIGDANTVEH